MTATRTRGVTATRTRGVPVSHGRGMCALTNLRLEVDRIKCDGHGLCAEVLPELIGLDDWGYPILGDAVVPIALEGHARRAVVDCPVLALRLSEAPTGR